MSWTQVRKQMASAAKALKADMAAVAELTREKEELEVERSRERDRQRQS